MQTPQDLAAVHKLIYLVAMNYYMKTFTSFFVPLLAISGIFFAIVKPPFHQVRLFKDLKIKAVLMWSFLIPVIIFAGCWTYIQMRF